MQNHINLIQGVLFHATFKDYITRYHACQYLFIRFFAFREVIHKIIKIFMIINKTLFSMLIFNFPVVTVNIIYIHKCQPLRWSCLSCFTAVFCFKH